MALTVKHPFTSTKPDDADSTLIRPSNWNDSHSIVVTAPGSGNRSVLGADNSETVVADKALFDATNPAAPGTASPGTALTAARRDHVHATEANTIENGKTGGITAAGARTSLQTGPAGAFGAVPAFVANAASIAPGTDKYSIYNIEAARTLAAAAALTIATTDTPCVGNKVIACYALTLGYVLSVVNGGPLAGTLGTFAASLTKPMGLVVYWDGTNYKFNGYVELLP